MQNGQDKGPIYCFSAAGSILKGQLCFAQVYDGLIEILLLNAPETLLVEVSELIMELVCIADVLYHRH